MHSSTVTVAVIDSNVIVSDAYMKRSDDDFRIEWFSGTGKGGQHKNKHDCSCRLIHIPTGIIETRQGRERPANLKSAKEAILITLDKAMCGERNSIVSDDRKNQVGSGMRGDKSFTLRFQDDIATNHSNGKQMSVKRYMKGFVDEIW